MSATSTKTKTKLTLEKDSDFETYSSGRDTSSPPDLRILHYNDVYHLDPSSAEPVGGAARFLTLVKEYQSGQEFQGQPELLTFFSGDVFNPSLESSITKGSHMVPILNSIGTACTCVGNHDLDFGVNQFEYLARKCNFPWLLANVLDPALGEDVPIGHAKKTHIMTASNGIKVGLIGLAEREWLETVNALPPDIIYKSATQTAKELVPKLRQEGAEIVIALTHQREPNDNKLAENMGSEIDIILGGHDHFYNHSLINGCHVLRSGSDFKQLSYITARRSTSAKSKWDFEIRRRDVISAVPQDGETAQLIDQLTSKLKQSLEKPVGWTATPLDARFTVVRTQESNLGNFICDIMRHHYQADCAMMAAGTIRGDMVYPPGPIRIKDITDCFPFEDPVVVIKVTGKDIWDALESGVLLYPAQEGRFPQVSNIKFTFDPSKDPGSRIVTASIGSDDPIKMDKIYVLCTRGYMARGKDGYKSLLIKEEGGTAEEIVSEENGILISMMLRQYFMSLKVLDRWKNWNPSLDRHWDQVKTNVTQYHPVLPPSPQETTKGDEAFRIPTLPAPKTSKDQIAAGWQAWTAKRLRQRKNSVSPFDEHVIDNAVPTPDQEELEKLDDELRVMRRYFGRWCRKAGVQPRAEGDVNGDDLMVKWTQAIAPRLEGRITIVGKA
ncbi:flagellar associated protein [Pyricularia oryzae 70-15]|uniref:Flagellar associated protein n=1 Tax=Pyricularia oryzae (strain 70-15 / ATCC MYA-4617 / FGSC 8958) TaxID=242507 RepID=G4NIE1_PYRO7|nr:flagellar associated protein [Pyricularia oryzae 70-15]EHA48001.1 flagellar associated protein [Pyricularia oryzae 70-15]KAI7921121.1 flagellar associated protein [Pyricularia oryzae]KAI7924771.1 flagellar associated protein [Pyricularia oryzae]